MEHNISNIGEINKGWEITKSKQVFTIPLSSINLPKFIVDIIVEGTNDVIDNYTWYSFLGNFKLSLDKKLFDKNKYDIFPSEMARANKHTVTLYEQAHGAIGTYCSWNNDIKVGFLEHENHYGYFIKYK